MPQKNHVLTLNSRIALSLHPRKVVVGTLRTARKSPQSKHPAKMPRALIVALLSQRVLQLALYPFPRVVFRVSEVIQTAAAVEGSFYVACWIWRHVCIVTVTDIFPQFLLSATVSTSSMIASTAEKNTFIILLLFSVLYEIWCAVR